MVCCSWANAQNKTTLVQRMNEIKSQTEIYFWDQATFLDTDTAKLVATERLLLDINNNRSETDQLSVEDVMPYTNYINIDRGEKKQCFAYIKKSDAIAIGSGNSVVSNAVVGVPVNTPVVNRPVQRSFVPDAFVQRVMETKNFMNAYKLLKSLQTQGQVLQFGKLKDVENYSSLDLILFDMQSQEIVTMLSGVTGSGSRTNLVNGSEDSLDNYPTNMTAVIWYIKK
jgi:hypothetical protein